MPSRLLVVPPDCWTLPRLWHEEQVPIRKKGSLRLTFYSSGPLELLSHPQPPTFCHSRRNRKYLF